eukprot:Gregarina_sp_Poly_1__2114@NODE_155_length_12405_cov_134_674339_g137_i0_p12_GENE_NODE_155_length_12405_cov_134_674339_g137_i0NODE_155_length_12405_cov_134_674339_g137_i0_p12_ORF_typecomplete_len102_score0_48DEFB136/PF17333_2/0_023_NODE_155_length_12405_cov_134_674339_g137_i088239128
MCVCPAPGFKWAGYCYRLMGCLSQRRLFSDVCETFAENSPKCYLKWFLRQVPRIIRTSATGGRRSVEKLMVHVTWTQGNKWHSINELFSAQNVGSISPHQV